MNLPVYLNQLSIVLNFNYGNESISAEIDIGDDKFSIIRRDPSFTSVQTIRKLCNDLIKHKLMCIFVERFLIGQSNIPTSFHMQMDAYNS